jgi:sulfur transfer protein SufE
MSLEQFARENSALEVRVPGCAETVWWVPNSRAAEQLMRQGISRGRIWTAQELLQVWEGPPLRQEDAQTLARLKATLNCELSSIRPPDADEEPGA